MTTDELPEVQESQRIDYRCKFCGCPGVAILGCTPEEAEAIGMHIAKWRQMLSCNRCADFQSEKGRIVRAILSVCHYLESARAGRNKKLIQDAEGLCKTKLVEHTQRYIAAVSFHFRRKNNWDVSYAEAFMDYPSKAPDYLKHAYAEFRTGRWA